MARHHLPRFISGTLLLLLIGAGAGLVAFQFSGGRTFSIASGSMTPAMKKGGLVGVKPVASGDLHVGDVITFMSPIDKRVTITHRIVEMKESKKEIGRTIITTKGDANKASDQPFSDARVVGRVEGYVPFAGFVLDFIRKPAGLLLLIYIPALMVVGAEIRKLMAYYKSQEPYVLPEVLAMRKRENRRTGRSVMLGVLAGVVVLGATVPTYAAFGGSVTMSENTIKSVPSTTIQQR